MIVSARSYSGPVQQTFALPTPVRIRDGSFAEVAQLVEQGSEKPRVAGSIPALWH